MSIFLNTLGEPVWQILTVILVQALPVGILLFALPSRSFRCAWFGIIAHSGQSIFLAFLILGLVLGLA